MIIKLFKEKEVTAKLETENVTFVPFVNDILESIRYSRGRCKLCSKASAKDPMKTLFENFGQNGTVKVCPKLFAKDLWKFCSKILTKDTMKILFKKARSYLTLRTISVVASV
jgi:hypothetical protein